MRDRTSIVRTSLFAAVATVAMLAIAPNAAIAGRAPPRQALPVEGVVNINTASSSELLLLPGIGPGKARAIVAYRTAHGLFHAIDDLAHVKGIGRRTLVRIKEHITLSGPTTLVRVRAPGGGSASPNPPPNVL